MAIRADITKEILWFRLEKKILTITVTEGVNNTPVNLATTNLRWRVLKGSSLQVYLQKQTGNGLSVTGNSNNIVTITVDPDANDYINLPAGRHYHELWDLDNDAKLSFGDVYLYKQRA